METIKIILDFSGYISTIIVIVSVIVGVIIWVRGISPALYRLGNGLAKRKIAIFAKGDNAVSLEGLLMDSKLFRQKNILKVISKEDVGKAEEASVYLVYWHDWANDISEILNKKSDKCAMVVYAPYDKGKIPDEQMKNLDGKRHTAVTNFRGRLLNDIVTAMITTSL
ncbi:MAG: hypothetical protein D4S01_05910 [Dehalococcoidia bacterium]|nr:MAG: hypothetical protein D4S01_05910 [Dehalococcoidia bacterium]